MYNFYAIEGKKVIDYKPKYEQYSRAFSRISIDLLRVWNEVSELDCRTLKRLDSDLFKKSLYLHIRWIPLAFEESKKRVMTESEIYDFFVLVQVVESFIAACTVQEFMQLFPVTKEYDGDKYGMKDYFWAMERINQIPDGQIGEERASEFLLEYCNRDIERYVIGWMEIINDVHKLNGGRDIAVEFFESEGFELQTFHEASGFLVDDKTGERHEIKRPVKKTRKLFSVVSG